MLRCTSLIDFFLITVVGLIFVGPSLASPLPMPLALMMADYSPSFVPANHTFSDFFLTWRDINLGPSLLPQQRRSPASSNDLLKFYDAADSHANNLKTLAAQSSSVDPSDPDFQNDFVNAFSGFNTNMDGFSTAFADSTSGGPGSSDKGLANYDKTNDLETLLKNIVNLNKGVLGATNTALGNLPILGPILGPLIYNLKCLIDKILDILENCSDSEINQLQPLLGSLLGEAVSTTCRSGVKLLDLCV